MDRRRLLFGFTLASGAGLGVIACTGLVGDFNLGPAPLADGGGGTDAPRVDANTPVDSALPVDAFVRDTSTAEDSAPPIDGSTCDGSICSNACVDLTSDAANCNRCGHSCGTGGTCTAGVCQPMLINNSAASLTALATDTAADDPTSVSAHVFWATNGSAPGVFQDNVAGGNVIQLVSGAFGTSAIVVHGASVYWPTENPGNGAIDLYAGTVGTAMSGAILATSSFSGGAVNGLVYDAASNQVYGGYTSGADTGPNLFVCTLTGSPACKSAITFSGVAGKTIATDGTYAYLVDQNGAITAVTLTSPYDSTEIYAGAGGPDLVRVDGTHLYWSDDGAKTLWRSMLSGAQAAQIASPADAPDGIAADAVYLYWTDSAAGTISYAPIGGGGPTTPYVTQTASSTPMLLVRDTGFLYWNNNSSLYRVALP